MPNITVGKWVTRDKRIAVVEEVNGENPHVCGVLGKIGDERVIWYNNGRFHDGMEHPEDLIKPYIEPQAKIRTWRATEPLYGRKNSWPYLEHREEFDMDQAYDYHCMRDEIAQDAMKALIINNVFGEPSAEKIADMSYGIADAMMRRRQIDGRGATIFRDLKAGQKNEN